MTRTTLPSGPHAREGEPAVTTRGLLDGHGGRRVRAAAGRRDLDARHEPEAAAHVTGEPLVNVVDTRTGFPCRG